MYSLGRRVVGEARLGAGSGLLRGTPTSSIANGRNAEKKLPEMPKGVKFVWWLSRPIQESRISDSRAMRRSASSVRRGKTVLPVGGLSGLRGGFEVFRRAADAAISPGVANRGTAVGGTRRSARRRVHDGVEGFLRPGDMAPVGPRRVLEAALVAHDGDGRVGRAGEIARQIAHVRPATFLVVGEFEQRSPQSPLPARKGLYLPAA